MLIEERRGADAESGRNPELYRRVLQGKQMLMYSVT